jgi:poly(3-hydroxybutyrate) depolymerase
MAYNLVRNALNLSIFLSSAFANSPFGQTFLSEDNPSNITIKSGKLERNFLLHIPRTYDAKTEVPLILSFHGRAKTARYQEKLSQFSNASFNPDAIAVYPNGYMVCWLCWTNLKMVAKSFRTRMGLDNGKGIQILLPR